MTDYEKVWDEIEYYSDGKKIAATCTGPRTGRPAIRPAPASASCTAIPA